MNTLIYRCFLAVAEEQNFTRAAERLFMSQQSLSHHISKLEETYNVTFFKRTKPLQLTYAGQRMLKLAQQVVALERQVKNEMGEVSSNMSGELFIGTGRNRSYLLTQVLPSFYKLFPHYTVHCLGGFHQQLLQMLLSRRIDMIVSSAIQDTTMGFESVPVTEDYLILCITDNLLDQYCPEFSRTDFSSSKLYPFSFFEKCPLSLASSTVRTRMMSEAFFKLYNFTPNIITTADYTDALLSFVLSGLCATICYAQPIKYRLSQMDKAVSDHIRLIPIQGLSKKVQVQATWNKDTYHTEALETLRQLLQNVDKSQTCSLTIPC